MVKKKLGLEGCIGKDHWQRQNKLIPQEYAKNNCLVI